MSKKKKFSSRIAESVDPMTAFIDDSEELATEAEEPTNAEELAAGAEEPTGTEKAISKEEKQVAEPVAETKTNQASEENSKKETKSDVLDLLHGAAMQPKVAVLEKNSMPLKLQNQQAEKVVVKTTETIGQLHDLVEVARQHAVGYQSTWDASIKAYSRHMGFPSMASLEMCKDFLRKWGAKLKD